MALSVSANDPAQSEGIHGQLEAIAQRLDWDSTNTWTERQPEWLRKMLVGRDPIDLGVNLGYFVDGLRQALMTSDRRGALLAQLTLLRSLELRPDSSTFARLRDEIDSMGEADLDFILLVQHCRALMAEDASPAQILETLTRIVDVAEQLKDGEFDNRASDVVGNYARHIGAFNAARLAHAFELRGKPVGSTRWVLGQLHIATTDIAEGDLVAARRRLSVAAPHLAFKPEALRNYGAWLQLLCAERIDLLDRARVTEEESLAIRKRALRRFVVRDLGGIVPVEDCLEEILAGTPTDPSTGLVLLPALRSLLDETVAIGTPAQLASVGVPEMLKAADRLDPDQARHLIEQVVRRFSVASDAGLTVARLDLDRYVLFGDGSQQHFEATIDTLLEALRERLPIEGTTDALRLEPFARVTAAVAGDTGYSVWERVFSTPRVVVPGPVEFVISDSEASEQRYKLVQALLGDSLDRTAQVEFQPIVDVRERRVVGFESLLRWESEELGRLSPVVVFEAAEQSGAIGRLEQVVVSAAVQGAAALRAVDPACRVNVNLTPAQLRDTAMVEHLSSECHRHGLSPSAIAVELTESALVDHDRSSEALELLAERGFVTTLDDFGTGYSNLAYLVAMRNMGLKIDGSFVRRMLEDERADAVCRMLISAAESLGMSIVAEQVETDEHALRLDALGCTLHQGYRYAPSMTLEAAAAVLADPTSVWAWPDVTTFDGPSDEPTLPREP